MQLIDEHLDLIKLVNSRELAFFEEILDIKDEISEFEHESEVFFLDVLNFKSFLLEMRTASNNGLPPI